MERMNVKELITTSFHTQLLLVKTWERYTMLAAIKNPVNRYPSPIQEKSKVPQVFFGAGEKKGKAKRPSRSREASKFDCHATCR
jgi:hypothetical protein